MRKILIKIAAALFLFVAATRLIYAADKNVLCTNSECSGFDGALFTETNVSPGDSVSKTFSLKNESLESIGVKFNADEKSGSNESFLRKVTVVLYEGGNILYSGNLKSFLLTDEIDMGSVNAGQTRDFEIEIALGKDAGNEYQAKAANFSMTLKITSQESGESQVLGTSDAADSNTENPRNSNSNPINSLIGQVLGLSDTSGKFLLMILVTILSILISLKGIHLIIFSKRK